jgi:predicted Zn-dependent protease
MLKSSAATLAVIALISLTTASGQQQKTDEQPPAKASQPAASQEKKPAVIQTPTARLTSAKNVFIVRTHGGNIPYDTIRTTLDNWGRFTLVDAADKADLIIEVASEGGDNDVRVNSKMGPNYQTGQMEQSTSSTKDFSSTEVSMTVSDAHNRRVLWHATEPAKYSMKEKVRENNLVEAAEKLASKFHDRLEPPSLR